MKALVIEDNPDLVETITLCLEMRWPEVKVVFSLEGGKGIDLVETEAPDIVILDINLPDMSGFEVLRQIRLFSDVPVVVLTVRAEEVDKVKGLELGADDYVAKPFSHMELLARVKAVLRRSHMPELRGAENLMEAGDIQIDLAAHQVRRGDRALKLTPIEYSLLTHLVRNEGLVLSNRALLQKVWGDECSEPTDYVKRYIHRLRLKLGDDTSHPQIIISERGLGYKFIRQ